MKTGKMDVRKMTQLAILVALETIIAFVPILGSIPIGPIVATIAHIPVIIAGVTMGVSSGAFMGFVFGLLSFIVHSFTNPTITSFVFTPIVSIGDIGGNVFSIIICFIPRILLGVAAGLLYKWLSKHDKTDTWSYIVSSVLSTILHTVLVLFGIYFFFGESYAQAIGAAKDALFGMIMYVIATNGVLEAILAGIVVVAIAKPLKIIQKRRLRQ